MIYCAGIINPIERMEKLSIDAFRRAYEINVFGVLAMVCFSLSFLFPFPRWAKSCVCLRLLLGAFQSQMHHEGKITAH